MSHHYGWCPEFRPKSIAICQEMGVVSDFPSLNLPPKERYLEIYKPIWDCERQLFGNIRPTFRQEIGDCVAAARKQSCEKQQIFDIVIAGKERKFEPVFAPYLYALSRNQIIGGMPGDGSYGAAVAAAQNKYGTLFETDEGCPSYSGDLAREWGNRKYVDLEKAPYKKFLPVASNNKTQYVILKTVEEVDHAIVAGLMPIIGSTWGFRIVQEKGHFVYKRSTVWYHEMCFVARKEIQGSLYFYRLNSWGNSHNLNTPYGEYPGGAWYSAKDLESEIRNPYVELVAFYDFDEEIKEEKDFGLI